MSDDVLWFKAGLRDSYSTDAPPEESMLYTADGAPYRSPPPPVYGPHQETSWQREAREYHESPRLVLGPGDRAEDSRLVVAPCTWAEQDGEPSYVIGDEWFHDGMWRQEDEQGVVVTEAQLRAALAWIEEQKPRFYARQDGDTWSVIERTTPMHTCLFGGHTEESAREIVDTLNASPPVP